MLLNVVKRTLPLIGFVMCSLCVSNVAIAQYNFAPSSWTIVWQNSYINALNEYGYEYQNTPVGGFHQYRLTLEHDVSLDAGCSYFLFFSNYMNKLLLKNKK